MITDEELIKILLDAHPLVFGDLLIQYLELMRDALVGHVHPYHGKKPQALAGDTIINDFLEFDLNQLVSKNIRIN